MSALLERLRQRWERDFPPSVYDPALVASFFGEVVARYQEQQRHYHTLAHLDSMFQLLGEFDPTTFDEAAVAFAIWFHDVIYDPKAKDNEERSAEFARSELVKLGFENEVVTEVVRLVLLTQAHEWDEADREGRILLDLDLSILGADPVRYDAYADAIRREYDWVDWQDYVNGRSAVLRSFLERERIFSTDTLVERFEEPARDNLSRELGRLRDSGEANDRANDNQTV